MLSPVWFPVPPGRYGGIEAIVSLLTAVVARAPAFGGTVKSFDAAKALAVPGVRKVVRVPSGVVGLRPVRLRDACSTTKCPSSKTS